MKNYVNYTSAISFLYLTPKVRAGRVKIAIFAL